MKNDENLNNHTVPETASQINFIPNDTALNHTVAELHARLSDTEHAQVFIDAHLQCVFVNDPNPSRFVMLPDDVPQLATLPDLGPVIRKCIVHNTWNENFISYILHDCIPSSRTTPVADTKIDVASVCVLLNVLLATLLGLYPTSTKAPPFPMRAVFFRRIHALLTSPHDAIVAFATENRSLLVIALTEYVWSTLPVYFPVETETIQETTKQTPAFFTSAGQHFDAFRQASAQLLHLAQPLEHVLVVGVLAGISLTRPLPRWTGLRVASLIRTRLTPPCSNHQPQTGVHHHSHIVVTPRVHPVAAAHRAPLLNTFQNLTLQHPPRHHPGPRVVREMHVETSHPTL